MKYFIRLCVLLLCFCLAVPVIAQKAAKTDSKSDHSAFEGVVTFKKGAATSKQASVVTMFIKGDKFLADEKGEKIQQKVIVDVPKKMIYMIMDKEKLVMDLPIEKIATTKTSDVKLPAKAGKTQKIAGFDCEMWLDKNANGEVELWTNHEMGKLHIPEGQMGDGLIPSPSLRKLLKQGTYFPFLMIERDKSGKEITRLEVTNVEKKSLEDALFVPPKDYQRNSMPGSGK